MEFKVNDKVMGFHYGISKNSYFAGTISKISDGIITIIPLSCGTPVFINPLIDPIIEFDQEIYYNK